MAHYAYLDESGVVTQVIVGKDEGEGGVDWEQYYGAVRTSYNTRGGVHYGADGEPSEDQSKAYRFNYAGIGWSFDPDMGPDGAFIPPQPYPSWVLNPDTALWDAPVPVPSEGGPWVWDEDSGSWTEVVE
jgi:hypothetical protein